MKIEVDFENVLDDFVETVKTARYSTYDNDIQEYCEKMLDALPTYEQSAQIIYDIFEDHPEWKAAFDKIVEANKE